MLSKYAIFGILMYFAVRRKNHVINGPDCGMCCILSEKQAYIARRHAAVRMASYHY